MDFYNDLSRHLLKSSNSANKAYKTMSDEGIENNDDVNMFFDLAVKATTSQMAYLEHNRANHLMLKNVFESFQ